MSISTPSSRADVAEAKAEVKADIGNRTVRTGLQNGAGFAIAAVALPIINQFTEPDLDQVQLLAVAGIVYTVATFAWNWLEENTAFPKMLKGEQANHVCPVPIVDRIDQENWDTMAVWLRDFKQDTLNGIGQVLDELRGRAR